MSKKKSKIKFNILKSSPLIAVIAIIEVIILVCACTFAWFTLTKNTTISTQLLSVEPDSGLEIDFNTADEENFVVINQYILNDYFEFSPVTSTDGRNIFVPTTGSFDDTDTSDMVFREATVNDMNSKYICIDFTLTNTGTEDMPVYLSPKSSFSITKEGKEIEGKALRLAFYQNDGSSGDIEAELLSSDSNNQTTVYFYNTLGWEQPYAHIWKDAESDSDDESLKAWPGAAMTRISGDVYYYTFNSKYDSIIFNDGSGVNAPQSIDLSPSTNNQPQDGYIYSLTEPVEGKENEYNVSMSSYSDAVASGSYPVVSPGVSVGFQRPYAPVTEINNSNGSATSVVPAYASSIDNYSFGSKELFTIKAQETSSLSMIVWLEGTDPDCSGDTYSGKDIDIDLIFATKEDTSLNYSYYYFYDKTKEIWIDSEITTETGLKFDPVMQLYDYKNQKGYLMDEYEYTTKVVGGKEVDVPISWVVYAPDEIMTTLENGCSSVIFRRVNPLNENEVWNYWDTRGLNVAEAETNNSSSSNIKTKTTQSPEGSDHIIKHYRFCAFADGAPERDKFELDNGASEPDTLTYSCGGLWGYHDTQIVTLYDGTDGRWLKNSTKDTDTFGVLTIGYNYNGQPVEYKASNADDKSMFYFVVPTKVYSYTNANRPYISFKRYYDFNDDYSINSEFNNVTYHYTWNAGKCMGKFYQISDKEIDKCYWGSDMLYVQAKNAVTNKISGSHLQVHFYSNNTGAEVSGTSHYTTLYRHDYYAAKNDGYGYACVVPSDKNYYFYRIERCDPDDTTVKWNITPLQTVNTETSTNTQYSNTIGDNICAIDYMYLEVYLECSTSYCGNNWDPEIYVFKSTGGEEKGWPGNTMTWSSDTPEGGGSGYKQYKYKVNISNYDTIIFSNDYDGNQRRQTGNITIGSDTDVSGMIYQWDSSNQRWRSSRKSGVVQNETLHVTHYPADDWDKNGS